MNRIIKYAEPVPFHKALPGAKSVVIMKRDDTPAAKPESMHKGNNTMTDTIDRGPFAKMLNKQALALQAQIGGSYEQAYVKVYEDPSNRAIVDADKLEHAAQGLDAMFGYGMSLAKSAPAPAYDPLAKSAELAEIRGPAHAKMHSLAVDQMRAHPGQSYASAYAYLYNNNTALRNAVKAEHMKDTMASHADGAVDKAAAPPDPLDPVGSASEEMDDLVAELMRANPKLSRQQAFTRIYVSNGPLKARYDEEAAARSAFSYSSPGHSSPLQHAPNIGYSGRKPKNYAGG